MSRLKRLISEIHRRSLWQVLLIYVGAAWACFELIDAVTARLGLPPWLPGLAIVLFLLGLPLVVATAFVREVQLPAAIPEAEPQIVEADAAAARLEARRRHRFLTWRAAGLAFLSAFALWGVVAAGWLIFGERGAVPGTEREMVAVLSFENLGAAEDEYFADGLTDEIRARLARVGGLGVIGRASAARYKNTDKGIRQIGEELNVDYVLDGTVRWQRRQDGPDRIRVTPQLVRVSDEIYVWADVYEEELADIFAVQEGIAQQVTQALNVTLLESERRALAARPTENLAAYDHYLRGLSYFHQRTSDGLQRAIEAYEGAIELDRAFAPAYAGLASVYAVAVLFNYRFVSDLYVAAARALSMADTALALDPNLAEAYAARAYVKTFLWAPFENVVVDARQAIRLEPSSADAHGWYAHLLVREGRIYEMIREDSIAISLDPLAPGRRVGFAGNALLDERWELALREADRALALVPDLAVAKVAKAVSLLMLGRADQCVELDLNPFEGLRALCLYDQGKVAEASALIDSLSSMVVSGTFPDSTYGLANPAASIATYYAWIGDASASLAWFERSLALAPTTVLFWSSLKPGVFDKVRHDAAFRAGIERLRRDVWARMGERR
jgi:TolB-like protein